MAGDEARGNRGVRIGGVVVRLPCGADGRVLGGKSPSTVCGLVQKQQVGIPGNVLPNIGQGGMGFGFAGLPGVEKGEDGLSSGGSNAIQQLVVQGCAGLEALNRAFRFAFSAPSR